MEIRFRKKTQAEWLVLFILVMPFAFFVLMDFFGFPSLVKYTVDVAWLSLLLVMAMMRGSTLDADMRRIALVIGAFFIAGTVSFIFNFQSPFYYLWGIRNNARFFVFFFACVFFVKEHSVEYYLKFLDIVFWINIPIVLFQFFVLDLKWDYLGGLFGVGVGCNAYTNSLMVVVATKALLFYLNKRESLLSCVVKCAFTLGIAALSELKAYMIEFVILLILVTLFTSFSWRKVGIIASGAVGVIVAVNILVMLFPTFESWFNIRSIWETASSDAGYTNTGDLNRLTAIPMVLDRFLPGNMDKLIGLGLGNCDYSSSFQFLTSPFYWVYGDTNYVWFSTSFLVLETGILGFVLYCAFFVFVFLAADRRQKNGEADRVLCQMSKVMAVMSLFFVVYNVSMRTESAYLVYFILALPFIKGRVSARESAVQDERAVI